MKIKFITTILLLCMPILTFAASWADNGSYDVSWYKKSQTEFQISTAKELAGMAYLVNNNYTSFEGKTVKLAADINLGEKYWEPIGMGNTTFEGTFDGDGHRIYNVHINEGDRLYRSGVWVSVVNATLKNFKLLGTVSIDGDTTIGLVAGRAAKSTISDIYVDGIIKFKNESVSTNTGFKYWYQIGGCVGEAANCKFLNIRNYSVIEFVFGKSNGDNCYGNVNLYAGGIVGSGDGNTYNRCQTENACVIGINGYVTNSSYSQVGSGGIYYGGIAGHDTSSSTTFTTCYAKVRNFEGHHYNGTFDGVSFYYGGIVGGANTGLNVHPLNNCVAITSNYTITGHPYTWAASYYHTSSCFAGITCRKPVNTKICYSNNNVRKNIEKVRINDVGECGSTSFSSNEMLTKEFVDELNFYTQLEYDKDIWTLENGNLEFLPEDQGNGSVDEINVDAPNEIVAIYDLNGNRLNEIQNGVNIVVYKGGCVRKIVKI